MCGIATWIQFNSSPLDAPKVKAMVDLVEHRGPDDSGFAFWGQIQSINAIEPARVLRQPKLHDSGNFSLALGHRRLSILDLTSAGRQPMTSEDGRYWITYNGEIYNYRELRKDLENRGYKFATGTDTEVILAAFSAWGTDCVQRFNGMWAFVLYDSQNQSLFASRDRFGVKPLYFAIKSDQVGFSSELKQLHTSKLGTGRANYAAIAKFLRLGYVSFERETCFEGLEQIPAGHSATMDLRKGPSTFQLRRYYSLPTNRDESLIDFDKAAADLKSHLHRAVGLRLRSDVEVGSCLSGGLDSSAIVLTMRELSQRPSGGIQTFTSCWEEKAVDEWPYAETIADKAQAEKNQVFPDLDSIWDEIEKLAWHQDEPFGSTSIYAQWNVMRLAHQKKIKVLLDGQGADEALLGYHSYVSILLADFLRKGRIGKFIELNSKFASTGILSATDSALKSFAKTVYHTLNLSKFRGTGVDYILNPKAIEYATRPSPLPLEEMQKRELYTGLQALLRYEDRNSMAFSIEARTPFLDYQLVEFALKVPPETKFSGGWTKSILREAMKGSMPEKVRLRVDKKGFATPEAIWYAKNKAQIKSILLEPNSPIQKWVDQKHLEKWLDEIDKDPKGYAPWRLLSVHFWMKTFNLTC